MSNFPNAKNRIAQNHEIATRSRGMRLLTILLHEVSGGIATYNRSVPGLNPGEAIHCVSSQFINTKRLGLLMPKDAIRIIVRIVERPVAIKPNPNQPYQPPKARAFKAIANCTLNGKPLSRTATSSTEPQARLDAFNKLATLVAKQGGVFPVKGPGVEDAL